MILLAAFTFLFAYLLNITYISVFYHRMYAHRSIDAPAGVRKVVEASAKWVTGLDLKSWVVMHRIHHAESDTPNDPHSPANVGVAGVLLEQLASYRGVMRMLMSGDERVQRFSHGLTFDVSWLHRHSLGFVPYLLHIAIAACLSAASSWIVGVAYFAGIASHPLQGWAVNGLGHARGTRNFDTVDDSRNNRLVALLAAGEGYQNNHHYAPGAANFAVKANEWDWGYGVARILAAVGAVRIVERVDRAATASDNEYAQVAHDSYPSVPPKVVPAYSTRNFSDATNRRQATEISRENHASPPS